MIESKEELESLDEGERSEWKTSLKAYIEKIKNMEGISITSWQLEEETVTYFILFGSKITADGDCNHEMKRCLLFGRSRDITLPTKIHTGKGMVFPMIMLECESWIIRKSECWRTEAYEL